MKSGTRKYFTPASAPGRVTEKPTTTSVSTASRGIMIRETFSMPFCTPPKITSMVMPANTRKHTSTAQGDARKPVNMSSEAMAAAPLVI